MSFKPLSLGAVLLVVAFAPPADAQSPRSRTLGQPSREAPQDEAGEEGPIPPEVEEKAVKVEANGYCYLGPHPVDTRSAAGGSWDESPGKHIHFYAPIDLRLFKRVGDCYSFIGDPTDFGYRGRVYGYYGAHPLPNNYGDAWCFMLGGHQHTWGAWSPSFVTIGSWLYWDGQYDQTFWSYWPYYSHYYRDYYPHFYGGGRWYRDPQRRVAPRVASVPRVDYPPGPISAWPNWPPPGHPGRQGQPVEPVPQAPQPAPPAPVGPGPQGFHSGVRQPYGAWGGGPPADVPARGVPVNPDMGGRGWVGNPPPSMQPPRGAAMPPPAAPPPPRAMPMSPSVGSSTGRPSGGGHSSGVMIRRN